MKPGNEVHTLERAKFDMRLDEMLHFSEVPYDQGEYYIVMLATIPPFPGEGHPESKNKAVLCAAKHGIADDPERGELFGWVHIGSDTKDLIGKGLEAFEAKPDTWYYMLVSGGFGHRSRDHFELVEEN